MPKKGQKPGTLTISPTPFKSSFLAIPPSPFSPRTPLTPIRPIVPQTQFSTSNPLTASRGDAPLSPISWLWTCHQCNRRYSLGVTRRCLDDGHYFCSGQTTIKQWRASGAKTKVKRHRACASEFDYEGWKTLGRWRRTLSNQMGQRLSPQGERGEANLDIGAIKKKDCWNMCDYPSECRWGKRFGVHTPIEECIPIEEEAAQPINLLLEPINSAQNFPVVEEATSVIPEPNVKHNVWMALAESAKRRKSSIGSSPLVPLDESSGSVPDSKDSDGDVTMDTIDPRVLYEPDGSHSIKTSGLNLRALKSQSAVGTLRDFVTPRSSKSGKKTKSVRSRAFLNGFEPLERVASYDSGYHSGISGPKLVFP